MATNQILGLGMTPANRPNPNQLAVPNPYPLDYMGPTILSQAFAAQGVSILIPTHPNAALHDISLDVFPSIVDTDVQLRCLFLNRLTGLWLDSVDQPIVHEDNPFRFVIRNPGNDPIYIWFLDLDPSNASVDIYFDPGPDGLWVALPVPSLSSGSIPVNTVGPSITGTGSIGAILTCNRGSYTGTVPMIFDYQWQADSVDLTGATSNTYTVQPADAGKSIRCVVTAHNTAGSGGPINSNSIAIGNAASLNFQLASNSQFLALFAA